MTAIAAEKPRVGLGAAVVPLMALAVFINYVDRGNLATAGPLIKDELGLSASRLGLIISAFFWSYTPCQLLAGWLAEKINPYRTLAAGLALWSLATAATGLVSGFAALIALRIVLGLGESAAFPCSSKLIAEHLPHHKMGAANGLIIIGTALGPAFGTFVGGMLMAQMGWRPVFLIFGLGSLLWLIPWLAVSRAAPAAHKIASAGAAPSLAAIVKRREAWASGLGHFANNYAFYFVITWLPVYLVKARGFTMSEMAVLGGEIYLVYAAASLVLGWASDRLVDAGRSVNLVRKGWMATGLIIVAVALAVCAFGDASLANASLFAAAVGFGFSGPAIYCIGQTLAGPRAGGAWMGFQNMIGNAAGIVAPLVTGVLVDRTGSFGAPFAVAAAVALSGVVSWCLLIPKVAPLDWTRAASAPAR
ncbi:MFS transporter [Phenylobacterium sp.]|uniref:MFS transporter n=1 Tax=Phenylobacterium sp. TaxID=1871053 RepID=UPI002DE2823D|nr:MFS transporter [Phenylobacterium sp.]